ncbi:MAG: radical SAM family heme chaperone HemW [Firmicutes bacterium]|nr:radical SAM family heme chaperone HemW [Bacillota bacterium]
MHRGLYVHIPFCVRKCRYCDFTSFSGADSRFDAYLSALEAEAGEYRGADIGTVFIGGGTPSILSAEQLTRLFHIISANFNLTDTAEFTVEANPGTLTPQKAAALKNGGVNRVSMGAQSFNDTELKFLGRIHDAQTAYESAALLHKSGFNNINIDIMTSVPAQTRESLLETLKTAVSLPITHISAYSLILEKGTPLCDDYKNGKFAPLDDDFDRDNFDMLTDFLETAGFHRYEISNFAKDGYECAHNKKYWRCEEYIGIGLAAHSYIDGARFYNTSDMESYLNGDFHSGDVERLSVSDMMSEFMMMGLRMTRGVSADDFFKRFSRSIISVYEKPLKKFLQNGLMHEKNGRYMLSRRGLDVSNSIMCEFIL